MLKKTLLMTLMSLPLCLTSACELLSDELRDSIVNGEGQAPRMDPPTSECKPMGEQEGADCPNPRWEDRDGDGCIDLYVCETEKPMEPIECKPIPEDLLASCDEPVVEDRDGDGCPDYFACDDGMEPQEPEECKTIPDTGTCEKIQFDDRDGDGCIDSYTCLDHVYQGQEEGPPKP